MNVTATAAVVATRPVDFRKGHDSLAAVVEHELGLDPYSGVAVVFRPRRADFVSFHIPSWLRDGRVSRATSSCREKGRARTTARSSSHAAATAIAGGRP